MLEQLGYDTGGASQEAERLMRQIIRGETPKEEGIREVCEQVKSIIGGESNVVQVRSPVTVVGDVQGQLYDLLEVFKVGGMPPDTNYVFIGNYGNRTEQSVQTIVVLLCLKLRYPQRMTLLRGSHDTRSLSQVYGLYGECLRKYGNPNVWRYLTDLFEYFNLAAVIDDEKLALHAGIVPEIPSIDQIKVLNRFEEPEPGSAFFNLLHSCPS